MSLKQHEQSGNVWHPKEHKAEGHWRIEADGDALILHLEDDFRTDSGPDVKLYLSRKSVHDIGNQERVEDNGVLIALLQSFDGAQDYTLPKVDDFGVFKSLMLHCEKYTAVWCGAELKP
ncbi:MAG: DM13 domain-containing protein [Ahrensia sp.]|nr:DM13 domain-containing protein [Ahrensia sp.]